MTYQFNPTIPSACPAYVRWTDSIAANTTIDKTISVGTAYKSGFFWLRGINTYGISAGPSNVNGGTGKIRSSSTGTDASEFSLQAGVYSSTYSRAVDLALTPRMWNSSSTFQTIDLIDCYFDGSGNVLFRFKNNDGSVSRAMDVYAGVVVYA